MSKILEVDEKVFTLQIRPLLFEVLHSEKRDIHYKLREVVTISDNYEITILMDRKIVGLDPLERLRRAYIFIGTSKRDILNPFHIKELPELLRRDPRYKLALVEVFQYLNKHGCNLCDYLKRDISNLLIKHIE